MTVAKTRRLSDTVRKLLTHGAEANALNILNRLHPSEIAVLLGELPYYRKAAFQLLVRRNPHLAGLTLSELGASRGAELIAGNTVEEVSRVVQETSADDAAKFIAELPQELREAVLASMRQKDAAEVQELLRYPERTAGRIMNPNFLALQEDTTVKAAIARLQESPDLEMVFYVYVTDSAGVLTGVFSLRQLLMWSADTILKDLMVTEVIRVTTDTHQEDVARLVSSYNLLAVPVVDAQKRLVGIVTVDDVIDVIAEEATEDMYRLAGLDLQERVFTRPRRSVRMRIPWLTLNLATAFLAALVVSLFQGTIEKYALIAVFLPVVAGMGGNAAAQTLTVIVRGIALGELEWSNSRKALFKELMVGIANGLLIGGLVALVGLLWGGSHLLGAVLGLALVGNFVVAAVAGTMVPLTLRWLRVDPALASSVFVTTCTDCFGFLFYLGLATYLLRWVS